MNGLVLIDKPPDCTSHDVVLGLRKILSEPHIGHFGTLDPMASGLLVAALGKAARFFPFFSKENKSYEGRIRLGQATDTYDAQGTALAVPTGELPNEAVLRRAMAKYLGQIQQVPPPFSAKKFQGKPFYKIARSGGEPPRVPSPVFIHGFELVAYDPPDADIKVTCSSGTYIRSLAHDLGQDLGCAGHLTRLRRTRCGGYSVEQALTIEQVRELAESGRAESAVIPLEALLADFPRVDLTESDSRLAKNGRALPLEEGPAGFYQSPGSLDLDKGEPVIMRMFNPEGRLIALARWDAGLKTLHPFLVLE